MYQIHPNARTTPAVRAAIAASTESSGVLAKRYGVSPETIRKWRKRGTEDVQDHSSRPQHLRWRATDEERAIVCELRRSTGFPLDDLTFTVRHFLNRAGIPGGPVSWETGVIMTKAASRKYAPEVRERAVRMVFEHAGDHGSQRAAIGSIAAKIGCTAETLRGWVRQAERDQGKRPGPTTDEQERIKALEREVRELRQANEILRKASAYFAQAELDRPFKK